LLSMQKYNKFIMMSSRGCPAICTFCNKNAMFGQAYRYRSPANVIDELKVLISHGVKAVYFQDLEFSINQARTKEICKKLAEAKLPISWSRTTRVTSVNHEILSLMKDAGCTKILFGLETADPDVLKKSKKGITLPIVERVMDECDELGIKAGFHVIFGLPGETRKTMRNTAKFIKKHMGRENIEIDAGFTTIVYPGTELFEMAKQRNMVKGNPWKSMYSLGGIVDTEFKTHEEFLNEYAKVKRDIILHKFKLKHGSLFFLNPTFLRVGFKYIYKKAFPHFTD
jgi:anaerobic magnesium-protoporphyrin IX monomethyl ester cyclase